MKESKESILSRLYKLSEEHFVYDFAQIIHTQDPTILNTDENLLYSKAVTTKSSILSALYKLTINYPDVDYENVLLEVQADVLNYSDDQQRELFNRLFGVSYTFKELVQKVKDKSLFKDVM